MSNDNKIYSPEERYRPIGKLIEEVKLRRYSYQTGKSYISIVKDFLSSGKTPRDFLLSYSTKSKSTMRSAYFALKFFQENVLNTKFEEKLLLPKTPKNFRWSGITPPAEQAEEVSYFSLFSLPFPK